MRRAEGAAFGSLAAGLGEVAGEDGGDEGGGGEGADNDVGQALRELEAKHGAPTQPDTVPMGVDSHPPSRPPSALQAAGLGDFLRPPSRAGAGAAAPLKPIARVMSPPALLGAHAPHPGMDAFRSDTPGLFADLLRSGTPGLLGPFADGGRLTPSNLFLSVTPGPTEAGAADDLLSALMRPDSRIDHGLHALLGDGGDGRGGTPTLRMGAGTPVPGVPAEGKGRGNAEEAFVRSHPRAVIGRR